MKWLVELKASIQKEMDDDDALFLETDTARKIEKLTGHSFDEFTGKKGVDAFVNAVNSSPDALLCFVEEQVAPKITYYPSHVHIKCPDPRRSLRHYQR